MTEFLFLGETSFKNRNAVTTRSAIAEWIIFSLVAAVIYLNVKCIPFAATTHLSKRV